MYQRKDLQESPQIENSKVRVLDALARLMASDDETYTVPGYRPVSITMTWVSGSGPHDVMATGTRVSSAATPLHRFGIATAMISAAVSIEQAPGKPAIPTVSALLDAANYKARMGNLLMLYAAVGFALGGMTVILLNYLNS